MEFSPDNSDLVREIAEFIQHNISRFPEEELDTETPLISSGLIDSFNLIKLILFLEERYQVTIDPSEVIPSDFETIALTIGVVNERKS